MNIRSRYRPEATEICAPVAAADTIIVFAELMAPWIVGKGVAWVPQPLVQVLEASVYRVTSLAKAESLCISNSNKMEVVERISLREADFKVCP